MADKDDFYRNLIENLGEGIYFVDRERRITFWNKAAEKITGFDKKEVVGRRCMDQVLTHVDASGRCLCVDSCPLSETIADGKERESEVYLHHREGHRVPVRIRTTPISDEAGRVIGAVELFTDNSKSIGLEGRLEELERLALLDPLTHLPNRRYVESHLQARFAELRRNDWPFGVLYIDIDHFKSVNDRHGHETGDKVLRLVARTLDANSRPFDIVGRWGGEEFITVVANSADVLRLSQVGERLRAMVAQSSLREHPGLRVTVSAGAALANPDDTIETLLRRADEKLYRAKISGRNRVCV
jgi:diguanylate cyclase (GGDEF)-like protein/PAS domain S-box-containing protein